MQQVSVKPKADNPYCGFFSMKSNQQDGLLKEQHKGKLLHLDPRMGFTIISVSGRNMGMILNPTSTSGMLLFFVDLYLAEQFVEARRVWFSKKNMPVCDVEIGKWCPAKRCSSCYQKNKD